MILKEISEQAGEIVIEITDWPTLISLLTIWLKFYCGSNLKSVEVWVVIEFSLKRASRV